MGRRHRSYSLEFKRQVAQQYLSGEIPLARLARQHDISRNLIRVWIAKYEAGELDDEQVQGDLLARYKARIAELERKVGELVMENNLLKKNPPAGRAGKRRDILRRERPDGFSIPRGCRFMNLARSTYYYRSKARGKDDEALIARIEAICAEFPATVIGVSRHSFVTKASGSITSESRASCASAA